MFSRGNWSIIGIDPASLPAFEANLANPGVMLAWSQLAAQSVVHVAEVDAVGINPFDRPRLDEDDTLSHEQRSLLTHYRMLKAEDQVGFAAEALNAVAQDATFAYGVSRFRLSAQPLFGFWFVFNEVKDIGDAASVKEDVAYQSTLKPYKFLTAGEKLGIDDHAKSRNLAGRKQFPVLIDFTDGKLYAETTSKDMTEILRRLLVSLGIETFDVAWKFGDGDWVGDFLTAIRGECAFKEDIAKWAESSKLVPPEPLEDRELNGIVKNYFATAELATEGWVGLTTPADISLYPTVRCTAASPAVATILLATSDRATATSASLDFQERVTKVSKKTGEAKSWRNTIFSIDLNYGINNTEAGTAMLKGFDLPGFKKAILRDIRKSKQVPPIAQFWREWLMAMANATRSFTAALRETLDLDGSEKVGVQRLFDDAGTNNVLDAVPELRKMIENGTVTVTVDRAV